jgi:hypothetical protein
MIPADVVQKWWTQQGLPFGSPIRAFDYWTKGVAGVVEGRNIAPLLKGGGLVQRELAEGAFEWRNLQTGGGPPTPGIDRVRFMLVEDSRNGKK